MHCGRKVRSYGARDKHVSEATEFGAERAEEVLLGGFCEKRIKRSSVAAGSRGLESFGRDVNSHLEMLVEVFHNEVAGFHEPAAEIGDVAVEDDEDEGIDWACGVFIEWFFGGEVDGEDEVAHAEGMAS